MKGYKHKVKENHIPTKRNKTGRKSNIKNKTLEEIYGKEKALQIRIKLSESKRGDKNPSKREDVRKKISNTAKENYRNGNRKISKNNSTKKGGKRVDLDNIYFRSAWEADFARILKKENINYEYEKKIIINNDITYLPDFYLKDYDIYFEIKANNGNTYKYDLFKKYYPNITIYLIKGEEFKYLSKLYSYIIPNWESKKYYPEPYKKNSIKSSTTTCWKLFIDYLNN